MCCLSEFIAQSVSFLISTTLIAVHDELWAGLLCGLALFLLSVWFTVKSVLGLISLLQDKPI